MGDSTKNEHAIPRILVADDDEVVRRMLQRDLEAAGFSVVTAIDGHQTIAKLSDDIAVALVDLSMPGPSGMDCLDYAREHIPDTPIILISGTGHLEDAVAAMRRGAFDYFSKPYNRDHLLVRVRQALKSYSLARDNFNLRQAVSAPMPHGQFVGKSTTTQDLLSQVAKVAQLDSTVLITGPSGTGKTTLARRIHEAGSRAPYPFVAVSCAALPRDLIEAELFGYERGAFTGATNSRPGRAEVAHRGTLFLDEIGDLPLELQPKLLTFLQDRALQRIGGNQVRKVDVRVVAATHQDLEAMCRNKTFREDLYFRLNVLSMRIPALHERPEDVEPLAVELLSRIARRRNMPPYQLTLDARSALMAYHWPGNVRELENVLERATAFCRDQIITRGDLELRPLSTSPNPQPAQPQGLRLAGMTLEDIEREAIRETLTNCGGNKAAAARQLGISEKSIYNKMKRLGLFAK